MIIERRKVSENDDLAKDVPANEPKEGTAAKPTPPVREGAEGTMSTTNADSGAGAATGGQGSVPEDTTPSEGQQPASDTSDGYGQDTRR